MQSSWVCSRCSRRGCTYSYNAVSQLTSYTDGTGTTSFTYDSNGSQVTETDAASFGYDVANHAVEVTPDGQPTLDYTYNGATQQRLVEAGSVDLNESLLGLTAIDIPGVATIAATRTDTGMAIGQRIATVLGTERYYFLTDGDGSVVAVTDSSGNIVNEYEYEPFGQAIPSRTTVSVVSIWKWQGGMNDTNSDTYKFGIRYYQPEIGRWTQTDPVEGQLAYAYSNNDPINQADLSGAMPWDDFDLWGGDGLQLAGVVAGIAAIPFSGGTSLALTAGSIGLGTAGAYVEGGTDDAIMAGTIGIFSAGTGGLLAEGGAGLAAAAFDAGFAAYDFHNI